MRPMFSAGKPARSPEPRTPELSLQVRRDRKRHMLLSRRRHDLDPDRQPLR